MSDKTEPYRYLPGIRRIVALLAAASLAWGVGVTAQPPAAARKAIIAYVFAKNRVLAPEEIAAEKLTRINYAFATIQQGRMVNGFSNDDQNLATLVSLKKRNPDLTIFISVGGWEWSGGFSDMALSRQSRAQFIESAMDYLKRHNLDGLDIDWEYPGQPGSTDHFRTEDKQNFTLLLKELRNRFTHEQRKLHHPLYLSIAAGASSSYLAHTEMEQVQRYVDTINLMAYDYYLSGEHTGHHAPLFTNPDDPKKVSADRSVTEFEAAGVPAAKLVLGVPFYGHPWGAVPDVNHGLFQPGERVAPGYVTYETITTTLLGRGYERYWDQRSSSPYLYDAEKKSFISYEDPQSLTLKARYILDHQLGGVMFWDYAADPSGSLLDRLYSALTEKPGRR